MICSKCGQENEAGFKFCDGCGTPFELSSAKKVDLSEHRPESAEGQSPTRTLSLETWAGWRWLLATNYGQLSISDSHLNHDIRKFWASKVYSIIVKIFSWGFDPLSSLAVGSGATTLRSINSVRILAVDWVVWKGHFLFIWAGGMPDVFFFSSRQLAEVQQFVAELKFAIANAKHAVSK